MTFRRGIFIKNLWNEKYKGTFKWFSSSLGDPGSGAGKGGGGGGSIKSAGGAFGKMQVAREEEYFHKKQREQLADLKAVMEEQMKFHEEEIKRHQEALEKAKRSISEVNEQE